MKTKKTLAILLSVMMILSVVPMFASAAETLSWKLVEVWPTITYKNADGKFYFGQTVGEGLGIDNTGIVVKDAAGNIVEGEFIFNKDTQIPKYAFKDGEETVTAKANLKFVPKDTEAYSGFTKLFASDVTYTIYRGTLKLVDETNDKPVTTGSYASGTPLSEIAITGGEVVNALSEEANANGGLRDWKWKDETIVPTESGYYTAVRSSSYFYDFEYPVYVEIDKGVEESYGMVTSWPTITNTEWTKGMTVADLVLTGGEATVEGTFAITASATATVKPDTDYSFTVKFTPADPEVKMAGETETSIRVNLSVVPKDIIVESITPITIEYGTMLKSMGGTASYYGVKTDVADAKLSFNLQENKDAGVYDVALAPGEYTVKGYVNVPTEWITGIGGVNFYNPTTIDVPIIVTKKQSTAKFGSVGSQEIVQEDGSVLMNISYRFNAEDGKFGYAVLKVNGETVVDNITETAGTAYYGYDVRESGTYTATLEYVPAENDYIEYAETVQTKTVDITVELKEEEPIIPIIPGGDDEGDEDTDIDLDLDFDGSHKFDFVNLIQNLIAKLKAFIQQIGDFFSNMSLEGLGNIMG